MKRKSILFSILSVMCIGFTSGCGEDTPKYKINASTISNEQGRIEGGGTHKKGATIELKVYPNDGCTPTGLNYRKTADDPETLKTFTSVGEKYSSYQFLVNEESAGNYVAVFECKTNSIDSEFGGFSESSTKTVTIEYKKWDSESQNWIEAKATETFKGGAKVIEENYFDWAPDKKVTWYTDKELTQAFGFSITGNENTITLYAKEEAVDLKVYINDAIKQIKDSSQLIVRDSAVSNNNSAYKAIVLNLNKITEADTKDYSKVSISVATKEGADKYLFDANTYYEYSNGGSAKLPLKDSGFDLSKINSLYNFIKVIDIDANNYTIENGEQAQIDYIQKGENDSGDASVNLNCIKYELKDEEGTVIYTLYLKNGKIYKFDSMLVEYPESKIPATIAGNAKDMYLIKLFAGNDTELNNMFDDKNKNFDEILKIVPAYGETVENILNDFKKSNLKKYYYTVHNYINEQCTADEYAYNSVLSGNVNLCLNIKGKFDTVESSINKLKNVSFDINTSTIAFGEPITKSYNVSESVDILSEKNRPQDMNVIIWDTFGELKNLSNTYDYFEFEKDDTDEENIIDIYSFYKENDSVPYLSVKLNKDGKISEIIYLEYDAEDNSKVRTYTSVITYSE